MAKFIKAAGPLAVEVVEKFEEANIKGPTHSLGAESLRFLRPVLTDHWRREAAHRLLKEDHWSVGAVNKTMNALVHDMWMSWQWRKGNPLIAEANGVPPATLLVGPPCLACGWFLWHHGSPGTRTPSTGWLCLWLPEASASPDGTAPFCDPSPSPAVGDEHLREIFRQQVKLEHLKMKTVTWQPPPNDPTAGPSWEMLGRAPVWELPQYDELRKALLKGPLEVLVTHSATVTTLTAKVSEVLDEVSLSIFNAREPPAGLPSELAQVKIHAMVMAARGPASFVPPYVIHLLRCDVPLLLFGDDVDVTNDTMAIKKSLPACLEQSYVHYVKPPTTHPLMTTTLLTKAVKILYTNPAKIRVQVSHPLCFRSSGRLGCWPPLPGVHVGGSQASYRVAMCPIRSSGSVSTGIPRYLPCVPALLVSPPPCRSRRACSRTPSRPGATPRARPTSPCSSTTSRSSSSTTPPRTPGSSSTPPASGRPPTS